MTASNKVQFYLCAFILYIPIFTASNNQHYDKLYDTLYETIKYSTNVQDANSTSFIPCVSLGTEHKVVGCSSNPQGNQGVLKIFEKLRPKKDYKDAILLIEAREFNRQNLRTYMSPSVEAPAGIIVDDATNVQPKDGWSPDASCPNKNKGMYGGKYKDTDLYANCSKKNIWNEEYGQDLFMEKFDFPIFRVQNATLLTNLIRCYNLTVDVATHKCSVEMQSKMFMGRPAKDCIQRKTILGSKVRCNAFVGNNIISLINNKDTTSESKIIWLTTQIDAKGFFYELAPGQSSTPGIILLFTILHTLANHKSLLSGAGNKQIIISFINGDAYDYIGSQAIVADLKASRFLQLVNDTEHNYPKEIKLENIETIIELGQLTDTLEHDIFVHHDNIPEADSTVKQKETELFEKLKAVASGIQLDLKIPEGNQPLPPSSIQSFKREKMDIRGLYISDFEKKFSSNFVASRFDVGSSSTQKLVKLATSISRMVLTEASSKSVNVSQVQADSEFTSNLSQCFFRNPNCTIFQNSSLAENIPNTINLMTTRFMGINTTSSIQLVSQLYALALRIQGTVVSEKNNTLDCKAPNSTDKTESYKLIWNTVDGSSECVQGEVFIHKAMSPVFKYSSYGMYEMDEDYENVTDRYSTWVESIWDGNSFSMRWFILKQEDQYLMHLFASLMFTGCFSGVNWWVTKYADELFQI